MNVSELIFSNITIQWGVVDCIHRNGDITGYIVRYEVQGSGSTQTESISGGAATETIISELIPSTNYSIEVAAVNSAGTGLYSNVSFLLTRGTLSYIIICNCMIDQMCIFYIQLKFLSCQLNQHQPPPYPYSGLVLVQWWTAMR